jgi:hypothetical protein
VGDIDFKVTSAAENSNKFPKTGFWKEKSVEDVVTLGPRVQATLVYFNIGWRATITFWDFHCYTM